MTCTAILVPLIVALLATPLSAGVFSQTGHGNPVTGPSRAAEIPRGSCGQCHVEKSTAIQFAKGLWRENDNELCYSCHRDTNVTGTWPGQATYDSSDHKSDPRFSWPGPSPAARREMDAAGKCVNCHNPHGARDRSGPVPSLLIAREKELCITCHDGSPSVLDIGREIRKPFSHPTRYAQGKHGADEGGDPDRYSSMGGARHAECADCHNAHAVNGDPVAPTPPAASNRNARVGRVRVVNGFPGSAPMFEYRPASDLSTPVLEYEICFKCHSSWTRQPAGQPDMALLFNTENASFHPVEGQGKNPGINPASFAGGRNSFSTIYCSDCHGSDDSNLRGPHGSQFPAILRKSYLARSVTRFMTRDELCFACHNFDTYVNPVLPGASRFNASLSPKGHTFHVGEKNVPCYSCHDSHGSPRFPALIVTGRNPGLISFSTNATGGSCLATCHTTPGAKSYLLNYPR